MVNEENVHEQLNDIKKKQNVIQDEQSKKLDEAIDRIKIQNGRIGNNERIIEETANHIKQTDRIIYGDYSSSDDLGLLGMARDIKHTFKLLRFIGGGVGLYLLYIFIDAVGAVL